VLQDFAFHDGTTMDLNVHYYTIGDPANDAVVVLHGTTGSGKSMMGPNFADALYGPGQPLDADQYYLIFPDAIGTGGTTKPSDGLRASFPHYTLDDMVDAQHRLLTEGLGVSHVRVIFGYSMGGMNTWTWGVRYPDFADALIPMAALPAPMAGRNWMMRRMLIDSVRNDPAWNNGDYTEQRTVSQPWLDITHDIVAEIADQTTGKTRQPIIDHGDSITLLKIFDPGKRIGDGPLFDDFTAMLHADVMTAHPDNLTARQSNE
jgi:homoserine acetyltransferase